MERAEMKKAVETLLFITDQPIGVAKITQTLDARDREEIASLVHEIQKEYGERGGALQVLEIAEGYQMATRPESAKFVRNLFKEKMAMRLSTAALETLSIIGYKQPLTRAEIEQVRGVEVIAALETLLEKGLIKVAGRKESVGRPLLYGTTTDFLRRFGLRSLEDLPPLDSFKVDSDDELSSSSYIAGAGPFDAVQARKTGTELLGEDIPLPDAVEERLTQDSEADASPEPDSPGEEADPV